MVISDLVTNLNGQFAEVGINMSVLLGSIALIVLVGFFWVSFRDNYSTSVNGLRILAGLGLISFLGYLGYIFADAVREYQNGMLYVPFLFFIIFLLGFLIYEGVSFLSHQTCAFYDGKEDLSSWDSRQQQWACKLSERFADAEEE